MHDESTLTGRLKRYAKVSTAMTSLVTRLASEKYLGVDINRQEHAKNLQQLLGGLKGPLMKIAQFLATIPGALPPEYAEELLSLQSNAPAMGWPFVRRRMAAELGPDWSTYFHEFGQQAVAAASLGQVHKAVLKSGETVACKLQYPEMQSAIEADLGQLNLFLSVYQTWNQAIDTSYIREEIQERLPEELDYLREALHVQAYQTIFSGHEEVRLPNVFSSLTTKRLLTMSWLEGDNPLNFTHVHPDQRNGIAQKLFRAWYYPFYHYGVIHGDPHPGNYKILSDGTIGLLDLGCVRRFQGRFVQGVIHLYYALLHNKKDQAVAAYESWGFTNLSHDIIEIITQWARLLYAPLLEDRVRLIQDDLAGKVGWETATKVHEELNKTSGIRPPREFVFMDRAAVGIGSVIMRLQGKANWYQLFHELIEGFDPDKLDHQQAEAFTPSLKE